jgi:acyl carrier protein phosphodiesterase
MNFLAHLYFADDTADSRMGSLLGDFVKGKPDPAFSQETLHGILLHRAIDEFTDRHPIVRSSKALISPPRRRFAGIIVDICYDHCLCHHWSQYSDTSLAAFTQHTYASLESYTGFLPDPANRVIQRFIDEDWLQSYQSIEGISSVLNRVSKRLRRTNSLYGSVDELTQHYQTLNDQFLGFFPELIQFVKQHPFYPQSADSMPSHHSPNTGTATTNALSFLSPR